MRTIPGTIPEGTKARLIRALPEIIKKFGTPCFVYDAQGIYERGYDLQLAMQNVQGYRQYYAVKAWPNPANLKLQAFNHFGFDCSSPYELHLMKKIGVMGEHSVMFTSNNSQSWWFDRVQELGGIINLDDVSLIPKVQDFPKLICFRLNPGKRKSASGLAFSQPYYQKYGITWQQLVPAFRAAKRRGAKRFGLHMMVASNCRDEE